MRRAARVDGNHAEITDALRHIPGLVIVDLSASGEGVPDLCFGWEKRWIFCEVKNPKRPPSKRRLTPAQVQFHAQASAFGLPCHVVESVADCLRVLGISSER